MREHLIYRRGAPRPGSLFEIGNADLEIAAGSSHAKTLENARNALPDLVWVENAGTNSQALLDGVADGTIITRLPIRPVRPVRTTSRRICALPSTFQAIDRSPGRAAIAIRALRKT